MQFYEADEKKVFEDIYFEARDLRSVRTDKWKLIYYSNRTYGELYHLKEDPHERNNLWNQKEYRDIQLDLTRRIVDHMISLGEKSSVLWNIDAPVI